MKRFRYEVFTLDDKSKDEIEWLNDLGNKGWELIEIKEEEECYRGLFKIERHII